MASDHFGFHGEVCNVPAARVLMYLSLFDESLHAVSIQNSGDYESLLILFLLLTRLCFITGNSKYEKVNFYMLNMLEHQKKTMPKIFEATCKNIRNNQSVTLEYVHAQLATSMNRHLPDTFTETNRILMAFPSVEDGHILEEIRYGIKTKRATQLQ